MRCIRTRISFVVLGLLALQLEGDGKDPVETRGIVGVSPARICGLHCFIADILHRGLEPLIVRHVLRIKLSHPVSTISYLNQQGDLLFHRRLERPRFRAESEAGHF